ncbi:amidohydrolase [Alkalibacterium putridalgicola]|uniref:Amidohydrolase n=1 Tax=Alkalibacterium putridalgicola TaxID=426703 RepID=A0A1H7SQG2_9LACT|nr:amidohydrolase [Alkalibacterium putridalgicola]GEK89193.1 peptidase [Alkalibacterium putridalgicola]SEL74346.1 amidohydrolase [Alkalibacterium putridalgicola]
MAQNVLDLTVLEEEIQSHHDELIELRRDFHRHPELGTKEFRTSEIVEKYLNDLGIPTQRMFNTGVVGLIEGPKPGKTILLRGDMDALPVTEETNLPFKSENPGVMHACGHDGHTSMLMIAAKVLKNHQSELTGNVKLVFQPNEEEEGAKFMVEEGVLENPKVDAAFGVHLWSQVESGKIGIQSGPVMAEMFIFKLILKGRGGHTSAPHEAKDPVPCAANIITSAQTLQTREISVLDPTVIAFGKVVSDGSYNALANTVTMEGTLRYLYDGDDDTPQHPRKRFRRLIDGICAAHDIDYDIEIVPSSYSVINDEESVAFLKERVLPNFTTADQIQPYFCLAGEDFSEFINRNNVPGAFVFIGTGDESKGTTYPHHAPNFDIDEDTLITGVKFHVHSALEFLK